MDARAWLTDERWRIDAGNWTVPATATGCSQRPPCGPSPPPGSLIARPNRAPASCRPGSSSGRSCRSSATCRSKTSRAHHPPVVGHTRPRPADPSGTRLQSSRRLRRGWYAASWGGIRRLGRAHRVQSAPWIVRKSRSPMPWPEGQEQACESVAILIPAR
jgi:hypothetical protein